jgi:hypothetical protein
MDISQFLAGMPAIFEGYLLKRDGKFLSIQIHPGLTIDLAKTDCQSVEEATDPLTGKTHIRVTLTPEADIKAVFQPRLARLALKANAVGVPFSVGGSPQGSASGPVFISRVKGGGGGLGNEGDPTAGEFATRSYVFFWGWCDDDTTYTDTAQSVFPA